MASLSFSYIYSDVVKGVRNSIKSRNERAKDIHVRYDVGSVELSRSVSNAKGFRKGARFDELQQRGHFGD